MKVADIVIDRGTAVWEWRKTGAAHVLHLQIALGDSFTARPAKANGNPAGNLRELRLQLRAAAEELVSASAFAIPRPGRRS
jgi:hypothetical protein